MRSNVREDKQEAREKDNHENSLSTLSSWQKVMKYKVSEWLIYNILIIMDHRMENYSGKGTEIWGILA